MNNPKLNILVAFPYFKDDVLEYLSLQNPEEYRLMIDSGAFTAWNSGKTILLDEYCKFLDRVREKISFKAVQLDVIGDEDKTAKNYDIMCARGFDVMPVFTRGASESYLEELYRKTDYVLLGNVAFGEKNDNYVKWFLEKNGKRKAHLLGFTKLNYLKYYKPFSCDSSTWNAAVRFGVLELYQGKGETKRYKKEDFKKELTNEIINGLRRVSLSPQEGKYLANDVCWIHGGKTPPSFLPGHKTLALFTSLLCEHVKIYDIEKNIGTRCYLACGTKVAVQSCFETREFLKQRHIFK